MILNVACPIPMRKTFDYQATQDLLDRPADEIVGRRVKVPFGKKSIVGVVNALKETSDAPAGTLKEIASVLDNEPLLTPAQFELAHWLSRRYFCSFGEALFALLPPGKDNPHSFKDPEGVILESHDAGVLRETVPVLTADQQNAVSILHTSIYGGTPQPTLLHGAAATGKTEVYMAAVREVLAQGRNALFLVPEIGLAVQTVQTLRARFGEKTWWRGTAT
jgi:primosomal protein N' (replication factor Y)